MSQIAQANVTDPASRQPGGVECGEGGGTIHYYVTAIDGDQLLPTASSDERRGVWTDGHG